MDRKEAQNYIQDVRKDRKIESASLHNPETSSEVRKSTIGNLKAFHDLLHEDPNYRQAMRIISEIRSLREINGQEDKLVEKRSEFPTKPEERYSIILSSLANSAAKQITFLSISNIPGTITTAWELHQIFTKNSEGVWKTSDTLQRGHARSSLIPIGMVAEEVGFRNGAIQKAVGFTQTEAGKKYGEPIAKFLLKNAAENTLSFEKIFGSTVSASESRAPYNRALILEYLSRQKGDIEIRIVDIEKETGIPKNVVADSISFLQENGLVVAESFELATNKDQFTYVPNPEYKKLDEPKQGKLQQKVNDVIQILNSSGTALTIDAILSEIHKDNKDFKRKTVYAIIFQMVQDGYLARGKFKAGERQSIVTISEEGISFVNDVLTPIRAALSDTSAGEDIRQEWRNIPWREYAPTSLILHKENSRNANRVDSNTLTAAVRKIITDNPGIRTSEITQALKELNLPYKGASKLTRTLINEGAVKKEVNNNTVRWYTTEDS